MMPWLVQQARTRAETPALIQDDQRVTYAELAARAGRHAAVLARYGVQPGSRVLVHAPTNLQSAVWLHAILWRGAAFVPVDPRLPRARTRLLIERLEPAAWITADPDAPGPKDSGKSCAIMDVDAPPAADPVEPEPAAFDADRCATIMLTSGSTAEPKAVPLTLGNHRASTRAIARRIGMRHGDQWLLCLPLDHIGGLAVLMRSVILGCTVRLHPRFEPVAVLETLSEQPVTLMSMVPTMLQRILEVQHQPLVSTLRALLVGGAAAAPAMLARARALGWPVLPTWGMTEACSQLATLSPDDAGEPDVRLRPGVVGRPLPGVEVRAGPSGTLQVRGPMLFSGYLDDRAAGPDAEGWFSTGDVGEFLPDGTLRITGRADEVIISGGINVNLVAVQQRLGECPHILDVALLPLTDSCWGQRIGAIVQPRDPDADAEDLRSALTEWSRQRLVPAERPWRWRIVDNIPRSAAGKPSKTACAALLDGD